MEIWLVKMPGCLVSFQWTKPYTLQAGSTVVTNSQWGWWKSLQPLYRKTVVSYSSTHFTTFVGKIAFHLIINGKLIYYQMTIIMVWIVSSQYKIPKWYTPQIAYRVDVCPRENLPYIQIHPITNTYRKTLSPSTLVTSIPNTGRMTLLWCQNESVGLADQLSTHFHSLLYWFQRAWPPIFRWNIFKQCSIVMTSTASVAPLDR